MRASEVSIPVEGHTIAATVQVPTDAKGLIVFAHGSGSSRYSPRNMYVADVLHEAGLATLLLDLLTTAEGETDHRTAQFRFDIPFLASRLIDATRWTHKHPI